MDKKKIQAVAVFCGSKKGNNEIYHKHAATLGKLIAEHNLRMVYGGGNNGLMGIVATGVINNNGIVKGIIPEILTRRENQHDGISELLVVADMHIRKKMIYDECDAAFILPGGNGTLDELFEILTWNSLSIHNKQIFLLNSEGFYDALIVHLEKIQEEGFFYENWKESLLIFDTPEAIFSWMDANKH